MDCSNIIDVDVVERIPGCNNEVMGLTCADRRGITRDFQRRGGSRSDIEFAGVSRAIYWSCAIWSRSSNSNMIGSWNLGVNNAQQLRLKELPAGTATLPVLFRVALCPLTARLKVVGCPFRVKVPSAAPEMLKPSGKSTSILPFFGISVAVVRVMVWSEVLPTAELERVSVKLGRSAARAGVASG